MRQNRFFAELALKIIKLLIKICEIAPIGAVQTNAHLVDVEKCWRMRIYLQRSASTQLRKSPVPVYDVTPYIYSLSGAQLSIILCGAAVAEVPIAFFSP